MMLSESTYSVLLSNPNVYSLNFLLNSSNKSIFLNGSFRIDISSKDIVLKLCLNSSESASETLGVSALLLTYFSVKFFSLICLKAFLVN